MTKMEIKQYSRGCVICGVGGAYYVVDPYVISPLCKDHANMIKGYLLSAIKEGMTDSEIRKIAYDFIEQLKEPKKEPEETTTEEGEDYYQ